MSQLNRLDKIHQGDSVLLYYRSCLPTHPSSKRPLATIPFARLQQEVIENVLARRDTLAVMPTGGGKSLCYQIPSLLFEGLTVVVSPLIALMKDQVEQLRAYGVPSLFLNSTLSPQEYQENMEYVRNGEVKLLYVAPETLLTQTHPFASRFCSSGLHHHR